MKYVQAGEDLEEDEDEDKEDDEEEAAGFPVPSSSVIQAGLSAEAMERRPLLGKATPARSRSRTRRRRMSVCEHGDATVTQAVLMVTSLIVHNGPRSYFKR